MESKEDVGKGGVERLKEGELSRVSRSDRGDMSKISGRRLTRGVCWPDLGWTLISSFHWFEPMWMPGVGRVGEEGV